MADLKILDMLKQGELPQVNVSLENKTLLVLFVGILVLGIILIVFAQLIKPDGK